MRRQCNYRCRYIEELEASIGLEEVGLPIWDSMVIGNRQPKQQLAIRFDQDVIDWFKSEGAGYQARMNEVLRGYVDAMKRKVKASLPARQGAGVAPPEDR